MRDFIVTRQALDSLVYVLDILNDVELSAETRSVANSVADRLIDKLEAEMVGLDVQNTIYYTAQRMREVYHGQEED